MARRTKEQLRIDRAAADRAESDNARAASAESRASRSRKVSAGKSAASSLNPKSIVSKLPGNPPTALLASEVITLIALIAYGFLGPTGDGTGKMPDPRPIVATLSFWGLLALVGSIGRSLSTVVAWVGWILCSTVLVVGPRGQGIVLYLRQLAYIVNPNQAVANNPGSNSSGTGIIAPARGG
jgi:hypothetical protein